MGCKTWLEILSARKSEYLWLADNYSVGLEQALLFCANKIRLSLDWSDSDRRGNSYISLIWQNICVMPWNAHYNNTREYGNKYLPKNICSYSVLSQTDNIVLHACSLCFVVKRHTCCRNYVFHICWFFLWFFWLAQKILFPYLFPVFCHEQKPLC